MRIVIDARQIADHFPGIGRYSFNLIRALRQLPSEHTFTAIITPNQPNSRYDLADLGVEFAPIDAGPFSIAEHVQIPKLLRQLQADLFHAPYYLRPYIGLPCPSITTLYDHIPLLFPNLYPWRTRFLFDLLHRLAIQASKRVLMISASAARDLGALYQIAPAKIIVTTLAADPTFHQQPAAAVAAFKQRYGLPVRYLLTTGSNKPHKNLALLLSAWQILQNRPDLPVLVIAGHRDTETTEQTTSTSIRFLPNIAEVDLPYLYAGAELFIYPSLYEGFGLPVLEAMASGTPVICGAISSLPEVGGDAVAYSDVTNPDRLAETIQRVLGEPERMNRMRVAGLDQATRFSWKQCAEQTLNAYQQILERG